MTCEFSDASFPLDPFNYVEPETKPVPNASKEPVFAVPHLPPRDSEPINSSAVMATVMKKSVATPKTIFPEAHLPFLLDKVTALQSVSLNTLVEVVYQELRPHKIKKNAIEAKIRQIGEKCKERKYWVVKQSVTGTVQ